MSRNFDRLLRRTAQTLMPKREPEPDFTGWSTEEVVLWRLNHGKTLAELIDEATPARDKELEAQEAERERQWLAAEARMEAVATSPDPEPEPTPEPERPRPGEPMPGTEPKWWEEKVRWRHRGPEDNDEEDVRLNECIHEYDPLTYDDED